MDERNEAPLLPPNPAPYLTDWLFEIGPTQANGMGEGRIGWREIEAWEGRMGIELMPWEAKLLRRLSGEYADERYEAKKPDRIAPFTGTRDDIEDRRAMVDRKITAAFAGLVKKE